MAVMYVWFIRPMDALDIARKNPQLKTWCSFGLGFRNHYAEYGINATTGG